jgi:hypothetical protein
MLAISSFQLFNLPIALCAGRGGSADREQGDAMSPALVLAGP